MFIFSSVICSGAVSWVFNRYIYGDRAAAIVVFALSLALLEFGPRIGMMML